MGLWLERDFGDGQSRIEVAALASVARGARSSAGGDRRTASAKCSTSARLVPTIVMKRRCVSPGLWRPRWSGSTALMEAQYEDDKGVEKNSVNAR
mmetsp:Transcript_15870/g.55214  ORF Transcript_15870/g.55214 Transcript_15870/m.55214 type:complete len:95 (-) Transcript_15870:106-390(-)